MKCETEFRQAMTSVGFVTEDPILADGILHRVHLDDRDLRRLFGWYILFPGDIPCGVFGDWFYLILEYWCAKDLQALSKEEYELVSSRFKDVLEVEKQECRLLEAESPQIATRIWELAKPVSDHHPYFELQDINPYPLREYAGQLIVPLYDENGVLCNLQILYKTGSLPFQPGSQMKGCYHMLGEPNGLIFVAVDFLSAAKIQELMNRAVAVTFNDDNLKVVAKVIQKQFPDNKVIIAGNDDIEEFAQVSIYAYRAAVETDSLVAIPEFRSKVRYSFYDLVQSEGSDAARKLLSSPVAPPEDWEKPKRYPF